MAMNRLIVAASIYAATGSVVYAQPLVNPSSQTQPARDRPVSIATAVISGRVIAADTGVPLRRARLLLAGSALQETRTIDTDAEGRYEFDGLPPGRYSLSASRNGYLRLLYAQRRPNGLARPLQLSAGQALTRADFSLPRMSILSGRITDEAQEPMEGCTVMAYQVTQSVAGAGLVPAAVTVTDASGAFRLLSLAPGDYWLRAASSETWTVERDGHRESGSYSPTYYPGMLFAHEAQTVTLPLGQELEHIDFALIPGRAVSVSGTAFSSRGRPLEGKSLFLAEDNATSSNGVKGGIIKMFSSASTASDGSFRFKSVPTGSYKIQLSLAPDGTAPAEAASMPIDVADADIEGLLVTTSPGGKISGILETETGGAPSFSPSRIHMVARTRGSDIVPLKTDGQSGMVEGDWKFVISGVFGAALIRPLGLPEGWYLKRVDMNGQDVTDTELKPQRSVDGVRVVLTDKVASVSGTVVDQRGKAVDDFVVVLFPADERRWGNDSAKFVRASRADQTRHFRISNPPPGDYQVVALDDVEPGQWLDQAFLHEIEGSAVTISLHEAEAKVMELKLLATSR